VVEAGAFAILFAMRVSKRQSVHFIPDVGNRDVLIVPDDFLTVQAAVDIGVVASVARRTGT
jgi:hypothetical protein